jgi:hypothetical protein
MIWSAELVKAGLRIFSDTSLPYEQRVAGLHYGEAAMAEARERAAKIADKLWPLGPQAHGFYDPDGFMERAWRRGQNRRVYKRAYQRLLGVIIARDGLLPANPKCRSVE